MQSLRTSDIIDSIIINLSESDIVAPDKLSDTKMILQICLSKYEIVENKLETEVSTDIDNTEFYFRQFLLNMKLRGCTDGSIKNYNSELKNFLAFINKPIENITYSDIQNFLAYGKIHKKWADRTYNIKLIIIRTFFAYLYEEDYIKTNPGKKLHETKVEQKIGTTVTPYQREEIKCACKNEREQSICEMLYSTGARISELCALNIHDINFQNMTAIVYGKGRKEREIYFNAPAKLHLEKYLDSRSDNNPALFVSSKKPYTRLCPTSIRAMLKRIKQRDDNISNIKLTPHVFRRTVGTDMINKGAPLEIVAEKLGHTKLDTTRQCYASISKDTVHQANSKYVG